MLTLNSASSTMYSEPPGVLKDLGLITEHIVGREKVEQTIPPTLVDPSAPTYSGYPPPRSSQCPQYQWHEDYFNDQCEQLPPPPQPYPNHYFKQNRYCSDEDNDKGFEDGIFIMESAYRTCTSRELPWRRGD